MSNGMFLFAMLAQFTLGRLTPNLHRQWPKLRTFVDLGANIGHFLEEVIARWASQVTAGEPRADTGRFNTSCCKGHLDFRRAPGADVNDIRQLRLIGVEPHGENFEELEYWMSRNSQRLGDRMHLSLEQAAVSNAPGRARFRGHGEWGKLEATVAAASQKYGVAAEKAERRRKRSF